MKPIDSAWLRLAHAVRRAPVADDDKAPFGFSTRVAALAMGSVSARPPLGVALGSLSWRALGLAVMLMVLSIAANYSALGSTSDSYQDSVVDPVSDILTPS